MTKAGGTSVPDATTSGGWIAFAIVAPISAWLVHRISSGDECGWDYGSVGGACRSIILLSVIGGAAAGGLAVAAVRGKRWAALVAILVVALATLFAMQFQAYRHEGQQTMDEATCNFVNGKLMTCVRNEYGEDAYKMTRRSQDGCLADDRSYASYRACMAIEDCSKMLECVAGHL